MRIAVVTPFFKPRLDWLQQCHASVRAQTHTCIHILISDGAGPNPVAGFQGQFIELQHNHSDYGDTPRAVGSISALAQGFDAVAYLDADCWYEEGHIASLVELQARTSAAVCTSARKLYDYRDNFLEICPRSDGQAFADTNCLMVWRPASHLYAQWAYIPPEYHLIDDRYIFQQILKQKISRAHTGVASACYRTKLPGVFKRLGLPIPPEAEADKRIPGLTAKLKAGR